MWVHSLYQLCYTATDYYYIAWLLVVAVLGCRETNIARVDE